MVQTGNTGSEDPFFELKKSHRDYKVFDGHYERVGKVDELFVDEEDHPIYLGVSTGFLEASSLLIPMDLVRINDKRGVVEVDAPRNRIEDAPTLGSGDEISPEVEDKVRVYYGLAPLHSPVERPDDHARESATEDPLAFDERIDLIPGEREAAQERFEGEPPYREREEQLRRNREAADREAEEREAAEQEASAHEAAEREAAEREAAEREADLRHTDESRGTERPRDEEAGGRGESTGPRVRRLSR